MSEYPSGDQGPGYGASGWESYQQPGASGQSGWSAPETGGYGAGAPPTGGSDAYGQAYGQSYGQAGYQPEPYVVQPGQAYPPGYYPGYAQDPSVRNGALAALITGCVCFVACLSILAVPTAVLGGVALSKADTDPEGARKLTKWAWISLGIAAGVVVLLVIAYFVIFFLILANASTSTY